MRRGYKTWAEKVSVEQRKLSSLRAEEPLPARLLADRLEVAVLTPEQIPGITPVILHCLLVTDPESWSAATFTRNGSTLVIYNPTHSVKRQESDLMHELAHVLCEHQPSLLSQIHPSLPALRSYNPIQEEEAVWLGGCLQLPRPALLWAIGKGMDNAAIVKHYCASDDLVRFRRQMTGVERQARRRRVGY